jgi:hypothetical protein
MTVTSQDAVLTSSTPATAATFYSQAATEVVAALGSDEASGLTVAEAPPRPRRSWWSAPAGPSPRPREH